MATRTLYAACIGAGAWPFPVALALGVFLCAFLVGREWVEAHPADDPPENWRH